MLFAEVLTDAPGWVLIITSAGLIITSVLKMRADSRKEERDSERAEHRENREAEKEERELRFRRGQIKRERVTAEKVEAVKNQAAKAAEIVVEAAKEVKDVKTALSQTNANTTAKLDEGLKIQRATHTLVNLKTSKQLTAIRDAKQEIFNLRGTPEDKAALDEATNNLIEHLTQQAKVDTEYGADAKKMGTDSTGDKLTGPTATGETKEKIGTTP